MFTSISTNVSSEKITPQNAVKISAGVVATAGVVTLLVLSILTMKGIHVGALSKLLGSSYLPALVYGSGGLLAADLLVGFVISSVAKARAQRLSKTADSEESSSSSEESSSSSEEEESVDGEKDQPNNELMNDLTNELDETKRNLELFKQKIDSYEKEIKELKDLNNTKEDLEKEIDKLQEEIRKNQTQFQAENQKNNEIIHEHQKQIRLLENELGSKAKESEDLLKKISEQKSALEKEKQALETFVQQAEVTKKDVEEAKDSYDKLILQDLELSQKIIKLNSEIKGLEEKKRSLEEEINKLQSQSENKKQDVENLRNQIQEMETKLAALKDELEKRPASTLTDSFIEMSPENRQKGESTIGKWFKSLTSILKPTKKELTVENFEEEAVFIDFERAAKETPQILASLGEEEASENALTKSIQWLDFTAKMHEKLVSSVDYSAALEAPRPAPIKSSFDDFKAALEEVRKPTMLEQIKSGVKLKKQEGIDNKKAPADKLIDVFQKTDVLKRAWELGQKVAEENNSLASSIWDEKEPAMETKTPQPTPIKKEEVKVEENKVKKVPVESPEEYLARIQKERQNLPDMGNLLAARRAKMKGT